jgi:hypothetical protein
MDNAQCIYCGYHPTAPHLPGQCADLLEHDLAQGIDQVIDLQDRVQQLADDAPESEMAQGLLERMRRAKFSGGPLEVEA